MMDGWMDDRWMDGWMMNDGMKLRSGIYRFCSPVGYVLTNPTRQPRWVVAADLDAVQAGGLFQ